MEIRIKILPAITTIIDFFLLSFMLIDQYSYNNNDLICWCCLIIMTLCQLCICLGIYYILDAKCCYIYYDSDNEKRMLKDEGKEILYKGCNFVAKGLVLLLIDLNIYHSYLTPQSKIIVWTVLLIMIHRILIRTVYQNMV